MTYHPIPFASPDTADSNRQREAPEGSPGSCYCCDRPLAPGRLWWVHVVEGGVALCPVGETYPDEAADLNWWPIGPGCARKIPAAYRSKTMG